jgi:hypothetical protein
MPVVQNALICAACTTIRSGLRPTYARRGGPADLDSADDRARSAGPTGQAAQGTGWREATEAKSVNRPSARNTAQDRSKILGGRSSTEQAGSA